MLCDNRNTELGVRTNAFNYKPTNITGKTLTEKKLFHLLSKLFPKVGLDWDSSVLFFICIFSWFEVNRSILRIQKSLLFPIFLLYTNVQKVGVHTAHEKIRACYCTFSIFCYRGSSRLRPRSFSPALKTAAVQQISLSCAPQTPQSLVLSWTLRVRMSTVDKEATETWKRSCHAFLKPSRCKLHRTITLNRVKHFSFFTDEWKR